MTTGRINQVTIVSPKGLGQAFLQNRMAEIFCYRHGAANHKIRQKRTLRFEARQKQPSRHRPVRATYWLPLSPSMFPRARSTKHRRESVARNSKVPSRCPKRRPQPESSAIQRPSTGGYLLILFVSGLAIGQPSTEPIRQH